MWHFWNWCVPFHTLHHFSVYFVLFLSFHLKFTLSNRILDDMSWKWMVWKFRYQFRLLTTLHDIYHCKCSREWESFVLIIKLFIRRTKHANQCLLWNHSFIHFSIICKFYLFSKFECDSGQPQVTTGKSFFFSKSRHLLLHFIDPVYFSYANKFVSVFLFILARIYIQWLFLALRLDQTIRFDIIPKYEQRKFMTFADIPFITKLRWKKAFPSLSLFMKEI